MLPTQEISPPPKPMPNIQTSLKPVDIVPKWTHSRLQRSLAQNTPEDHAEQCNDPKPHKCHESLIIQIPSSVYIEQAEPKSALPLEIRHGNLPGALNATSLFSSSRVEAGVPKFATSCVKNNITNNEPNYYGNHYADTTSHSGTITEKQSVDELYRFDMRTNAYILPVQPLCDRDHVFRSPLNKIVDRSLALEPEELNFTCSSLSLINDL